MNEFESDWISLIQSFVQNGWIQDGRIEDDCHHQINQIELVWVSQSGVRVFLSESERRLQGIWIQDGSVWIQHTRIQDGCHHQDESECMSEMLLCIIAESKMAEFKMSAIIKLNENELVWDRVLCKIAESKMAVFKMAVIIKLGQYERVKFFLFKWLNPRWQISRWLTSSSWVRMNEFESDWISLRQSFVHNSWIQDGRIQDVCHHQVEWEWISLRQSFVQNCWIQDGRIEDGCHHQVESEWMSEIFFLFKMAESQMAEFKMADIIKLSQNE